ncbi:MAG: lytic transglycosylase domain-containing protein [Gammaproteobacteria bacterium]
MHLFPPLLIAALRAWRAVALAVVLGALARPVLADIAALPGDRLPTLEEITRAVSINKAIRLRLAPHIAKIARKNRLDQALLHAVITVESAYNPNARSRAGAMGLMQLMPGTAAGLGVTNPYDPIANVSGGARYLRLLIGRFGTINLALAAYNSGEGRVLQGRRTIPPILETRKYVVSVIHFYMRYKKEGY